MAHWHNILMFPDNWDYGWTTTTKKKISLNICEAKRSVCIRSHFGSELFCDVTLSLEVWQHSNAFWIKTQLQLHWSSFKTNDQNLCWYCDSYVILLFISDLWNEWLSLFITYIAQTKTGHLIHFSLSFTNFNLYLWNVLSCCSSVDRQPLL